MSQKRTDIRGLPERATRPMVIRWIVAGVLCLLPVSAWSIEGAGQDQAMGLSPMSGMGVAPSSSTYSAHELAELEALEWLTERFIDDAESYRSMTDGFVRGHYEHRKDSLTDSYEGVLVEMEDAQRVSRSDAIEKFESFVGRYPDEGDYTPDAMFRLAELYFERAHENYLSARQSYSMAIDAWDPEGAEPEPIEPMYHYEPSIAIIERLVAEFPEYRLVDGALYLLGFCLQEHGYDERALEVYEDLVERRPDSPFAAEVWTRIGEYYFDSNELDSALLAYSNVLGAEDSPFYDKALYKLAWTHYRLADPVIAPEEYRSSVDTFLLLLEFNEQTKLQGEERGGDLRKEAIQYVAISYAEEQWGGSEKLVKDLRGREDRSYHYDILAGLGDVYFDQTRYQDAINAYRLLQSMYPWHPKMPSIQQQIVRAFERNSDLDGAGQARIALSLDYGAGSAWAERNADNPDALEEAEALTAKSLYAAALFRHRQAQQQKEAGRQDEAHASYQQAADFYGRYIKRFPHDENIYELSYFYAECLYYSGKYLQAAELYRDVRDNRMEMKYRQDAAMSAVMAYNDALALAERQGELAAPVLRMSTDRVAGEPLTARSVPLQRQAMVDAVDAYLALAPFEKDSAKLLYKTGETYFAYDDFLEARRRFGTILQRYPGHEVARFASNLIIESYLTEQNFEAVEKFTRELLARPEVIEKADKEFVDGLIKFKSGALFKLAEVADAKGEYEEAGRLYMSLLDEDPTTEFADSAINNAAVAFEKAKRYDSATKLYERLVKEHPKSPLAHTALFRVGLNAERFFNFDKAIQSYMHLVVHYPKAEQRADATYNAALALENTQNYEEAAQQYLRYCELFPEREDAPKVCFRAGLVYEKMGDLWRSIKTFNEFTKTYRKNEANRDRVVEAYLRIAKAYAKLGDKAREKRYLERTVAQFKEGDPKAAAYAAEAEFFLLEEQFEGFRALRFSGTSKQQERMLKKKAETLKAVQKAYQGVLRFKHIDWTLASMYRIGQLYHDFADSLVNASCPRDVRKAAKQIGASEDEVCDEYRVLLEERAIAIEDKAVQAYETAVNKARELQVVNRWTDATLVELNRLRRSVWPLQKPAKSYIESELPVLPSFVKLDGAVVHSYPEPKAPAEASFGAAPTPEDASPESSEDAPVETEGPTETVETEAAEAGSTQEESASNDAAASAEALDPEAQDAALGSPEEGSVVGTDAAADAVDVGGASAPEVPESPAADPADPAPLDGVPTEPESSELPEQETESASQGGQNAG